MKKSGFTLIELLAVIIILGVLMIIAIPSVTEYISNSRKNAFKQSMATITNLAKIDYISSLNSGEAPQDVIFTYNNGVESSNIADKSLEYNGQKPENGTVKVSKNGDVAVALHDGTYCATKSFIDEEITIEKKSLADCNDYYSISKNVNVPKIAKGMTPIKWNGTDWVDTTENDSDWYSYDATNKKWANARTEDGSMWVWIPRYIYKISPGWHSNITGTIDVKFSRGTDDTIDGTMVLDTGTTSNASNNKWTNHPAFTFGDTELTGIWVAKFESSVSDQNDACYIATSLVNCDKTTLNPKIIPSAISWRYISVNSAFIVSRNMEESSIYGWNQASGLQEDGTFTTDDNGVDTHLIKNTEWGAVAYLSKSVLYGQGDEEVWINNANDRTTGCAGNSVDDAASTTGCINPYNTTNGVKASTTGTIYGVYDMSGGSIDYVSAFLNNGNASLSNGISVVNALPQYKDVYEASETDDLTTNYAITINSKGDAGYEVNDIVNGSNSWFGDATGVLRGIYTFNVRGGALAMGASSGLYNSMASQGNGIASATFRPVIVVGTGF